MCGIFGHYTLSGADPALVERMAARLAHRGPDGYGTYHDGALAFGAGRLAIIDLSAPAGPVFNEDRTLSVVFNGEIYNFQALRTELEALGHHFATRTDTEVIVHGYESWGAGVLDRLRGMFALCIYDHAHERLLLARDRIGEKPLYYTFLDGAFLFASEVKALFEHPDLPRRVNTEAIPVYLALGYVPPPQTMFAGIEKLAPGEQLTLERGQVVSKTRYWRACMDTTAPMDYDDSVRRVRAAVTEAVQTRMVSDVPVGAFLSGGVDSTAVVALMARETTHPIQTFTVGFDFAGNANADAKFNVDARYSELASKRLGTDHHAITIPVDSRLTDLLPRLVYSMDEPVSQQSIIQTVYVAALARQSGVPVLLSGDAGDELFAGYTHYRLDRVIERYQAVPRLLRDSLLTPTLAAIPRTRKLAEKSRLTDPTERYLTWMRMIDPVRFPELLTDSALAGRAHTLIDGYTRPLLDRPTTRHFADRIAFTSLNLWLAEDSNMRVDKMSMAMSIEARAPLEDHHLVDLAFSIPLEHKLRGGDFKRVFKDAVRDLVPAEILERPKWGFAPPTSDWLRTVFKPLIDTYLSAERVARVGYFEPAFVRGLVADHLSKTRYELWSIWPLLIFHLWYALYIECDLTVTPLVPDDLIR